MLAIGRGLSPERLEAYFSKLPGGNFKVKPEIQRGVEFRQLNLQESYAGLGKFDIVFCRNVLIYFSLNSRKTFSLAFTQPCDPAAISFWELLSHSTDYPISLK